MTSFAKESDDPDTIAGLRKDIVELTAVVVSLNARLKRNRKAVAWIATSLVFDLILTIVVTLVGIQQIQQAQQQQAIISGALCPLYDYIIRAYHPELQKPENLPEYKRGYGVLIRGSHALNCTTGDTPLPEGA